MDTPPEFVDFSANFWGLTKTQKWGDLDIEPIQDSKIDFTGFDVESWEEVDIDPVEGDSD